MRQGDDERAFYRRLVFAFLVVGGCLAVVWYYPTSLKGLPPWPIEEGTFELSARSADASELPREGLVLVDEYCHSPDRSEPSVTSVYRLVDGQAWRIRLLCPDRGTRSIDVHFSFMGTECASEENPISAIPKTRRLDLTVTCPQEPSE